MSFHEQTENQKLKWSVWYSALTSDAGRYGLVKVPAKERISVLPCNCKRRKKKESLEIYRARGDQYFRCNQAGCGALLK